MNVKFTGFIGHLTEKLKSPLPGRKAHNKLVPLSRRNYPENPDYSRAKKSSVLSLFYPERDKIMLVFIKRPLYDGVHSGQIAFPGGQFEKTDFDLKETALRETMEEVGIPGEKISIIGQLSQLYIPPSNFLVNPFVGYLNEVPIFKIDPKEVHEVFVLNIEDLLNDENLQTRDVSGRDYSFSAPCFYVDDRLIWGATSMMLSELLEVIRSS